VPRCRTEDGAYTDEQCHNATGYCWCVTDDGKPIPGSSTHGRQLACSTHYSTGIIALRGPIENLASWQEGQAD